MPFVKVSDIKMYYKIFYHEKEIEKLDRSLPIMIVLHGGPGIVDHNIEINFWSKFSSYLQVIFLDQRGCGLTEDGDPVKWNLSQCSEDLYLFSKNLGIENPIMVGNSWGGYVIMAYLAKYSAHPQALIFCDAEARVSLDVMKKAYKRIGHEEAGDLACDYYQNPEKPGIFEKWAQTCVPLFSRTKFTFTAPARVNMPMRIKFYKEELLQLDFRHNLKKICCPVLWLAGERNPTHPYEGAEEAAHYVPKQFINLQVIKDTGAPVYHDQPEKAYKLCMGFIKHLLHIEEKKKNPSILCKL